MAEVAAAALQLAQQVPLAAHVEVDLGQVEAARVLDQRLQAGARRPRSARAIRTGSSTTAPRRARPGPATGAAATARSGRRARSPSPSRSARPRPPRSPSSRPARRSRRSRNRAHHLGLRRRPSSGRAAGRPQTSCSGPAREPRGLGLGGARLAAPRTPRPAGRRCTPGGPPATCSLDPAGSRPRACASGTPARAAPACRPGGQLVAGPRRPGRRTAVSASVRGIGVAVMTSTCGVDAAGASASRWSTPNRCCSSITTSPQPANSTSSLISACVPIAISGSPRRDALSAGVELAPSARRP